MDKSNVSPYNLVLSNLLLSMLLFVPELSHSAVLDTVIVSMSILVIASLLVPIEQSPVSAMTNEDSIVYDHQESNRTSMRNHVLSYPCLFLVFLVLSTPTPVQICLRHIVP